MAKNLILAISFGLLNSNLKLNFEAQLRHNVSYLCSNCEKYKSKS